MRAIEFYSGIGGWNCAIQSVLGEGVHVVSAYDVNPAANAVYAINNHSTRPSAKSLEVVTAEELDAYRADIWMMSPPCQPHTRNNTTSKRDDTDPRSASFSNLINQLDRVKHPPQFIILENVVGFETSKSCADFLSQLCDRNYVYEQYIISPIQCGVPNSRPRYYCLAWIPIEPNTAIHSDTMSTLFTDMPGVTSVEEVMTLDTYLEPADTDMSSYMIDKEYISTHRQSCWCWDLVTRDSQKTACFTKGYTRYHKGTGSVLLVNGSTGMVSSIDSEHEYDGDWVEKLLGREDAYARYFSPTELLRLFGFPASFTWPSDVSKRKCYELIGNSINVTVASRLLRHLLTKTSS